MIDRRAIASGRYSEPSEVCVKSGRIALSFVVLLVVSLLTWSGAELVVLGEPSMPNSPEGYQLLLNPGMEQGFLPYGAEFRGVPCQVAVGWTRFGDVEPRPCWMDARVFAHQVMDTNWVESIEGVTSQVIVSTEPYVAGIYQRVTGLTPGLPYGFHAAMLTIFQTSYPPVQHGMMVKDVGMDPTGGTDPNAETVVWSEPNDLDCQWDINQRTAVVAQTEAMTVFVRVTSPNSAGDWPYFNQSFLDSAGRCRKNSSMTFLSPLRSLKSPKPPRPRTGAAASPKTNQPSSLRGSMTGRLFGPCVGTSRVPLSSKPWLPGLGKRRRYFCAASMDAKGPYVSASYRSPYSFGANSIYHFPFCAL